MRLPWLGIPTRPVLKFPSPLLHTDEDGPTVFEHACRLGLEGIVSKGLTYASLRGLLEAAPRNRMES
jgi:hypothetical protein